MRTFTTTHTVYNFDELSDDAKQTAIDQQREHEHEFGFEWLQDDLGMKLEDLLKQNKITYDELPKVYYSLGYSQGDGAMFEGRVYWKSYIVDAKQSGHYYHYNSKELDLYSAKTEKQASEATYDQFNEIYVDICKQLERYGYDLMNDATSDETIIENIRANEYEFTENGKLA